MEVGISGKDFAAEVRTAVARGATLDPLPTQRHRAFPLTAALIVVGVASVGILAVIALHGAGRSQAASDARAKVDVRSAQTAIEIFAVDHGDSYAGATPADLERIDASLPPGIAVTATQSSYVVTVSSGIGDNEFTITRGANGRALSTCTDPGTGACPPSGRWG